MACTDDKSFYNHFIFWYQKSTYGGYEEIFGNWYLNRSLEEPNLSLSSEFCFSLILILLSLFMELDPKKEKGGEIAIAIWREKKSGESPNKHNF